MGTARSARGPLTTRAVAAALTQLSMVSRRQTGVWLTSHSSLGIVPRFRHERTVLMFTSSMAAISAIPTRRASLPIRSFVPPMPKRGRSHPLQDSNP